MNNIKSKKILFLFLCAIAAQVFFVLSINYIKDFDIKTGRKIIVRTIPIDPRSLFRGDYINLGYDFSSISLNDIIKDVSYYYRGQTVYVKLVKIRSRWKASEIANNYINAKHGDEITLKGTVQNTSSDKNLNISYEIESYFVPEGKGKDIEKQIIKKRVHVLLSVNKFGQASVCAIFINGKKITFR